MELQLTTPALLFSTISLLLLAFTNRFLGIAKVIRDLHEKYNLEHNPIVLAQIKNLRLRLMLSRNMQFLLVSSLFFSVVCMFLLFGQQNEIAIWTFGFSLILLVIALLISAYEIYISTHALNIQLKDLENIEKNLI